MGVRVPFDGAKLLAAGLIPGAAKNNEEAVQILIPGETVPVNVRRLPSGELDLQVERSAAHRAIAAALGVGKLEREKAATELGILAPPMAVTPLPDPEI